MCDREIDPRDAVQEAYQALLGLLLLLSTSNDEVDPSPLSYLVRFIVERLGPAADQLHDYVPRDFGSST